MGKVVYNGCYGGYDLSDEACKEIAKLKKLSIDEVMARKYDFVHSLERHDEDLVKVVEELGTEKASSRYAKLCIEEVHSSGYRIDEYDGYESVIECGDDIYTMF